MSYQAFEPIAISSESTVVAEFEKETKSSESYQSEDQLEKAFIELLKEQAYEYLAITEESQLKQNLRESLETLNKITFSDFEWERFFRESVSGEKDGIIEKTTSIQEDHIRILNRDNGEVKNLYLIDKANVHNNKLQVINQYETEGSRQNRYDVSILVNGLPLVHIELKRRGVEIREAFNQINRYQRESFWEGSGLFEYVQLFVISNGTFTKYYSNTVRNLHVEQNQKDDGKKKTSNTYEFTSWWADANNKPITDLMAFGKTFFAKHTLLNILTKYCVFTKDKTLMVMRPYQIVATERILRRIITSQNSKQLGTLAAGGYVWHTTGSGKTLTSFKTAQLASRLEGIEKVLFVVDRKDLDHQTMKEYNKFEEGSVTSTTNTSVLRRQLEDSESRIIVTTMQKLDRFIKKNKDHPAGKKRVVLIFDECHRSQFGDMHASIRKAFSNYNLFGFTGTPIFADNSQSGGNPQLRTTEQAFGEKLHTYTIVDAITDKNVLPFRVDYINTFKLPDSVSDKQVSAIDTERALLAQERVEDVARYILDNFDKKTRRNEFYDLASKRVSGFNSIFAVASIDAAKRYYSTFKNLQRDLPEQERLKIGLIYSFAVNEEDPDGLLADEQFETEGLDKTSRDFLESAIDDYNETFGTSYDTSSKSFENYYKNLTERLRDRDLNLVIVVNMLLTGFDAPTLNTLWVDKNLHQHGLIQAFSRTNRILNSVKTYGNIVCFRDLESNTNDAISMFGNKEAGGVVLLRPYRDYHEEYAQVVQELMFKYEPGVIPASETEQKYFVSLYGKVLRLRNILSSFDEFDENKLLPKGTFQDYQSTYLEIHSSRPGPDSEKESILKDIEFEIELVKQVEINVDYILMLVKQLQENRPGSNEDKELKATIDRAVDSSFSLRSKKDLIEKFIRNINVISDVDRGWQEFISDQKALELQQIIEDENLDEVATRMFIDQAFRDGSIRTEGVSITRLMPAKSMFTPDDEHGRSKQKVADKLKSFFDRFFTLS